MSLHNFKFQTGSFSESTILESAEGVMKISPNKVVLLISVLNISSKTHMPARMYLELHCVF